MEMVAKNTLRAFRSIVREAEQIRDSLTELETRVYYPSSVQISDMPHAQGMVVSGSAQEKMLDAISDVIDRYRLKYAELMRERLEIENAIDSLDSDCRIVLRLKYIDGHTWEEVEDLTPYSLRTVHRIHGRALRILGGMKDGGR